jgi:FtsP/CotA-like multicopper oxidase with cupredoxin domain
MTWQTRRAFVQAGAALVGATFGGVHPASGAGSAGSLPIPPLIEASEEGSVSLTAVWGKGLPSGARSGTGGFNGNYLGPTVRVRSGQDVDCAVTNRLDEPTTVHWHGLMVPSDVDGGPHNLVDPGGTWRPRLPVRQSAATLWYHAHPHPRTGVQVYAGLAGMMIVADDEEAALGLPSRYGVDDVPIILQDRAFDADGTLVYPLDAMSAMQGVRGDVTLVNGAYRPLAEPPASWVRLRVLNAANARFFDLGFDDGRTFHWIGTDGGLLRAPVALRRLELAPGQRAEVLVDLSDGRAAVLSTGPDRNFAMGMMGGGMMGRRQFGGAAGQALVTFAPKGSATTGYRVPSRLARWSRADASHAARRRRLTLTMGGMMMGRGMGGASGHGIDGRPFDMARIDQRVRLGDTEIWEVSGEAMRHPFHIHGAHFEVLSRDGGPPDVQDQGRRDTIVVGEPVELLLRFSQPAAETPFMYHCHILEHEDGGMMGQYLCA